MYEVMDRMASCSQYTTLEEIVEEYYDGKVQQSYLKSETNRMKTWLNRHKEAIDYQNGESLDGGFRYKVGYEYHYKSEQETKLLAKLDDDGRNAFLAGGLQMLFDSKTSFCHLIDLECVSDLQNLCLVKVLAKHLGKRVISFKYMQGFDHLMEITVHPHYLKEYNSRWFLFGYVVEESGYPKIVNFALDRIVYRKPEDIQVVRSVEFLRVPKNFYEGYFKDIVGVTRSEEGIVETITFRTTDFTVHHLLRTKPVHASQSETVPFDREKNEGEFVIRVIPNIELQTRLLSYGPGLYVVGEGKFQEQMREAVTKMKCICTKGKDYEDSNT